ncbi:CMGC family protein kinase [Trichomonas vaginalis G3]|uniref:cyclin-dependent kinase n=1 Tax=Trichomonas vaginalis (strain ATCC PRA-98 / G3) TaxID=412133 RepID=A2FAT3_TRIV3|nr:cyclin-dependent protein serine/threonine kinase protein [Trichomonas vaginalis G3]EAX97962.1 CMGC family protein kinase [Trichomonas vaginalis G3]KAI5502589.1 cyclin-dependent protein serine/threonine kinase protein [Trichomonas vaginalis G3]|eukprot:XP_001310892.1 CMGC family protein kinase [Trichomonas vaginalis G3]
MKPNQEDEGISAITLREVAILKSLDHPNIVKLLDVSVKEKSIILVQEFLQIDLRKYLKARYMKPMDSKLLKSYAFQLLAAIYVLHTHRIMHRDLKPENLLLNSKGQLKLCDFGLARFFSVPMRQYSPQVVSLWYRAPELLFEPRCYELAIDIWSAGCIIAEMARGEVLFTSDSEVDLIHKILAVTGTPEDKNLIHLPQGITVPEYKPQDMQEVLRTDDVFLADLVSKMLTLDPMKRISAIDALAHPYFKDVADPVRQMSLPSSLL